jgi:CTP:molybdopterin cytidylyltransferase MocA
VKLLALEGQGGLRSFFHAHSGEVRRVPVDCPFIARDLDTWDDYRSLHQELFGGPPQDRALANGQERGSY